MSFKLFVLFMVLPLTSALANSCPKLSGSYSCKFKANEEVVIKISQQEKNKITTYFIDGSERIADGDIHSTPIDGLSNVKYTAVCDGSVTFHLDADVLNAEGRTIGTMYSHGFMYKMEDHLRVYEMGSYSLEEEYIPFDKEAVCPPID